MAHEAMSASVPVGEAPMALRDFKVSIADIAATLIEHRPSGGAKDAP